MNVFDLLNEEHKTICKRLMKTVVNDTEWTRDHIFEEVQIILAAIKDHFRLENLLIDNLSDRKHVKHLIAQLEREEREMDAKILELVQIHVDEPGFADAINEIAREFEQHCKFCGRSLYARIKERLSKEELKHVNFQVEQMVLSAN